MNFKMGVTEDASKKGICPKVLGEEGRMHALPIQSMGPHGSD